MAVFILYNFILIAAWPILTAYFFIQALTSDKFSGTMRERYGFYGRAAAARVGARAIWVHAVSVGEAVGAIPLIRLILSGEPGRRLVVTTTTKGGMEILRTTFGDSISTAYFPFDFPWGVRRALRAFRPDALVLMETEIWPNLISACRRRGIPVLLLNGRVSDRMFRARGIARRLYGYVFSRMSVLGMQDSGDADRIISLGAPRDSVRVLGNMKFDGMLVELDSRKAEEMRRLLEPEAGPIMVAGSTHPGEEEIVLDVFRRLRDKVAGLRLVIAPRHIERAPEVVAAVKRAGMKAALRSQAADSGVTDARTVVVLDTIGELRYVYSLAVLCFVGGSLIERGGHNVLEPAACGKAPFYGPYTANFAASVAALERGGGGVPVRDGDEFVEKAARYLGDIEYGKSLDASAAQIVRANAGAAERAYRLLKEFLK